MNHSLINSTVALQSLQQKLDLIGHNVANLNTVGYKRKDASFDELLTTIKNQPPEFALPGRRTPLGLQLGWGARLGRTSLDLSQGTLTPTENPLDLAISGDALFEVSYTLTDENGGRVETAAYTRNGAFQLVPLPGDQANLYLATKEGHLVRDEVDFPIAVPIGYRLVIAANGEMTAYNEADPQGPPLELGQLKLVRVHRPELLQNFGDNLFVLPQGVDPAAAVEQLEADDPLLNDGTIAVHQGFLEQSNVNLSDELTNLLMTQRAFQLHSQAIRSADTMMGLAINLRG
jgi:flagellar basal-body rod protein FlgG